MKEVREEKVEKIPAERGRAVGLSARITMLIALGVTGGIGAYKAVEVARGLQKRGHDVVAIMTRSARRFVGEVTFEAITRRPVITDQFARGANADIEHIALATDIGLLLVAPATANIIGKFANGIADDFLTSLYLATRAPVLLAPAMNTNMLEHPAVQRNLQTLAARGVRFVDPGDGFLACGWIGKGRLAEPEAIVEAAERLLRPAGLAARPARRRLRRPDLRRHRSRPLHRQPVERADGLCGRGRSRAPRRARRAGQRARRRSSRPAGVQVERVRSAAEMARAMTRARRGRRRRGHGGRRRRLHARGRRRPPRRSRRRDGPLDMTLVRTPDILAELGRARRRAAPPVLVGFAAETGDPRPRARQKLASKQVDLIVANDVSRRRRRLRRRDQRRRVHLRRRRSRAAAAAQERAWRR